MGSVHNLAGQGVCLGQTLLGEGASVPSGKVDDQRGVGQFAVTPAGLKPFTHLMVFPFDGSW